jgi:hypothetical protein
MDFVSGPLAQQRVPSLDRQVYWKRGVQAFSFSRPAAKV